MIPICCIALLPPGIQPDEQHLRSMAEVNTDGGGFAIVADGYVIRQRSMDAEALLEAFILARRAFRDHWAAIEFRLATELKPSEQRLHPFRLRGQEAFLFHNGAVPALEGDSQGRSDSQVLAEDVCPDRSPEAVEKYAGPYNRIAILQSSPPLYAGSEPPPECVIINRDQWIESPAGILYSNADFLGRGTGWDEMEIDGQVYRFNIPQPGQCGRCNLWHAEAENDCNRDRIKEPPRWRNETARVAGLR